MVPPAAFIISYEQEDALDSHHVSEEVVSNLTEREDKAFAGHCSGATTPKVERLFALRLLQAMANEIGPSTQEWLASVATLDSLDAHLPSGLPVERLPAVCAAVLKLVRKVDRLEPSGQSRRESRLLLHAANSAAPYLRSLGAVPADGPIEEADLHREEKWVLAGLRARVNVTTEEAWLNIFSQRVLLLAPRALEPLVQWSREQGVSTAVALVYTRPATSEMTPRRTAVGVLCVNMARAGMLPFAGLKPAGVPAGDWESLLLTAHVTELSAPCVLDGARVSYITQVLQAALVCSEEDMKRAVEHVLRDIGRNYEGAEVRPRARPA